MVMVKMVMVMVLVVVVVGYSETMVWCEALQQTTDNCAAQPGHCWSLQAVRQEESDASGNVKLYTGIQQYIFIHMWDLVYNCNM